MTQFYPIKLIKMMTGEMLVTGISNAGTQSYVFERPMVLLAVALPNQKKNVPQEVTVSFQRKQSCVS